MIIYVSKQRSDTKNMSCFISGDSFLIFMKSCSTSSLYRVISPNLAVVSMQLALPVRGQNSGVSPVFEAIKQFKHTGTSHRLHKSFISYSLK